MLKRTHSEAFGCQKVDIKAEVIMMKDDNDDAWPWNIQSWDELQSWVTSGVEGWYLPESISTLVFDFARHTQEELRMLVSSALHAIADSGVSVSFTKPRKMIRAHWWAGLSDDIWLIVNGVRHMIKRLPNRTKLTQLMPNFDRMRITSTHNRTRWLVWQHMTDDPIDSDDDDSDEQVIMTRELRICPLPPKDALASVEELATEFLPKPSSSSYEEESSAKRTNWVQVQRRLKSKIIQVTHFLKVKYVDARRGYNTHVYNQDQTATFLEAAEPLLDQFIDQLAPTTSSVSSVSSVVPLRERLLDLYKYLPEGGGEMFPFGVWLREKVKNDTLENQFVAWPECGVVVIPVGGSNASDAVDFLINHAKEMTIKTPHYARQYEKLATLFNGCSKPVKWTIWPRQFRWYCRSKRIDDILLAAERLRDDPPTDVDLTDLVVQFGHKNGRYRIIHGSELLLPPDWTHQRLSQTIRTWLPHRIIMN